MCIRDSKEHRLWYTYFPSSLNLQIDRDDRRPGRRDHHTRRCLLYTSDAADDLLCVDLGGRRIIKKKKKNENKLTLEKIVTGNSHVTRESKAQTNDTEHKSTVLPT